MNNVARSFVSAGIVLALAVTLPTTAYAAGPIRDGVGSPGQGEPDNDTQLSVLTESEAAFVAWKQSIVDGLGRSGAQDGSIGPMYPIPPCYPDPCPPTPTSKTLATRARQQINNYYCGPAAGQVVVNWSRGIIKDTLTSAGAKDPTLNWKVQATIGGYMGTTSAGTGGANLAAGLNNPNAVRKPVPTWVYAYASTGSLQNFHNTVVTDVFEFDMPLVLATAPHEQGAGANFLRSWPNVHDGAHHWITIRGYNGLWGSSNPTMSYNDSSAGYGGGTGSYSDLVSVLWQVDDWNQGGHIVW